MANGEQKMIDGAKTYSKPQMIDREKISRYLPKGNHREITDAVMEKIQGFEDSGISQAYGDEMLLTHMGVLKECKVSTSEYIDAVKFCCLVMGGMSASKAWEIVFPEKAKEVRDRNDGELSTSWSTMYNKTKIVTKLMAAMYVPAHIVYQPLNAWAIHKQYDLARGIGASPNDRVSPVVQQKAAEALFEMTKMPEDNKIQLEIGLNEESKNIQKSLFAQLAENTKIQMERLKRGESIEDVQKLNIGFNNAIDVELEDE